MSRFVRDSHAFSLLFTRPANWDVVPHCYGQTSVLKCVFYNLAFTKWLCGESSEAIIRGAGCLIMSIKQERGSRLRARPPTKNNTIQVRTAPACSTRHGRKGRKARLVQLRKEHAAATKTGKLSHPGWNQCKESLGKFCVKFAWVIFPFHTEVNTTWNNTDNARLTKSTIIKRTIVVLTVFSVQLYTVRCVNLRGTVK